MPRKPKKALPSHPAKPVHSQDELEELQAFCADIEPSEIPLEQWQSCHSDLDLQIPLFLTSQDLRTGSQKTLTFARTITDQDGQARRREPASTTVIVPPATADGHIIVLPGLGDRRGSTAGDVHVVVRRK